MIILEGDIRLYRVVVHHDEGSCQEYPRNGGYSSTNKRKRGNRTYSCFVGNKGVHSLH